MDYNSEPFSVMTIDGLHYIKSVTASDNPYELTLLCDTLWEGEVFEVPATVDYQGREYIVTGIDVGQSTKLENLRELRIPPTVRHIFPEACVGIKSLRKVNIPDYCRIHSGAFAQCGIEELTLGEHVLLEEGCFYGIRAKQVNIPNTTKWVPYTPYTDQDESDSCNGPLLVSADSLDDIAKQVNIPNTTKWVPYTPYTDEDESDSYNEVLPVSADSLDDIIEIIFRYSIWHYMEILKWLRKGEEWAAVEALAEAITPFISADLEEFDHNFPFSLDEILSLMDENEKHLISQFEDNYSRILNASVSDDEDLPF